MICRNCFGKGFFELMIPKMTYWEALLYGAVQGVTEYLPISSSAHLILLPKFLGTQELGLTFDVFLHVGTALATVSYFWRDWWRILRFGLRSPQEQIGRPGQVSLVWLIIATIPALIAGAGLHRWIESVLRGPQILMVTLAVGGVLLWSVDRWARRARHSDQVGVKDAVAMGIAQCFALVPGMSRSGSTMIGARLLGFDRASAARLSFLMSAPVTFAAIVYELRNWQVLVTDTSVGMGPILVAGFSSFVFGLLAIGGLLKMLRSFGFFSFMIYRVALAAVIGWTFVF